jgi:CheY-like chemotaxis protein
LPTARVITSSKRSSLCLTLNSKREWTSECPFGTV